MLMKLLVMSLIMIEREVMRLCVEVGLAAADYISSSLSKRPTHLHLGLFALKSRVLM